MLVELGLVEQRSQAVLEVLNDGANVTDVACRYGVSRQTVHEWLSKYANSGLGALVDRSSRPLSCPHQMDPVVEAPPPSKTPEKRDSRLAESLVSLRVRS